MEAKYTDHRTDSDVVPSKLDRGETEAGRFSIPGEKRSFSSRKRIDTRVFLSPGIVQRVVRAPDEKLNGAGSKLESRCRREIKLLGQRGRDIRQLARLQLFLRFRSSVENFIPLFARY